MLLISVLPRPLDFLLLRGSPESAVGCYLHRSKKKMIGIPMQACKMPDDFPPSFNCLSASNRSPRVCTAAARTPDSRPHPIGCVKPSCPLPILSWNILREIGRLFVENPYEPRGMLCVYKYLYVQNFAGFVVVAVEIYSLKEITRDLKDMGIKNESLLKKTCRSRVVRRYK